MGSVAPYARGDRPIGERRVIVVTGYVVDDNGTAVTFEGEAEGAHRGDRTIHWFGLSVKVLNEETNQRYRNDLTLHLLTS